MKVLYNACYGGFEISAFASLKLIEANNWDIYIYKCFSDSDNCYRKVTYENCDKARGWFYYLTADYGDTIPIDKFNSLEQLPYSHLLHSPEKLRVDKQLIRLVEEFGSEKCSGDVSKLKIEEVEKGSYFTIDEYDGLESIQHFYMPEDYYYADY